MRILAALLLAAAALPARAQFNVDVGKFLQTIQDVRRATSGIDRKTEIELGRDMASHLLGAMPLVPGEREQRYVNLVGRWLASRTERADLPWRFGVLDSPRVDAFALPGGIVLVTSGLLGRLKSEAELAGVLAHEIAHVVRRDQLKAIEKSGVARDRLVAAGLALYARGLDEADERAADRLAVVIAARGGYDPRGLPEALRAMRAASPEDRELAERLDALTRRMQPIFERYASQPQLVERFQSTLHRN